MRHRFRERCKRTYWFKMYDRSAGHDCVVSLYAKLTLIVACICQTVDGAALWTGTDWHARNGLVASYTVYCTRPTHIVFWLLKNTTNLLLKEVTTCDNNALCNSKHHGDHSKSLKTCLRQISNPFHASAILRKSNATLGYCSILLHLIMQNS